MWVNKFRKKIFSIRNASRWSAKLLISLQNSWHIRRTRIIHSLNFIHLRRGIERRIFFALKFSFQILIIYVIFNESAKEFIVKQYLQNWAYHQIIVWYEIHRQKKTECIFSMVKKKIQIAIRIRNNNNHNRSEQEQSTERNMRSAEKINGLDFIFLCIYISCLHSKDA